MHEVIRTSRDATDAPRHEVRDTLRSVDLPTGKSLFGPVRKQQQPPVRIPGQRKASDTLRPRPTLPKQKLTARALARDLYGPDRWDAISAADAFGTAPGNAA